ncbi:hypothetical protein PVAND_016214 [Polypedilum vanderplanki]|uniref:Uncharacterized protein n=1 Tax=Polypedilum vanderplanki TaxID=319348 RepID=A0A9J6BFK5_POLVA|nr:hypothetical protein PVAND_016214 [Polypedilum vanderplanki]
MELFFKRKTENLKLATKTFHKLYQENSYKQVFQTESFNVCQALNSGVVAPHIKLAFDWLKSVLIGYERLCTSSGQINFLNISAPDSPFLALFPMGFYSSIFSYADDLDDNLWNVTLNFIINR